MKTLTFKYTKKDGSVSDRVLLAMVMPGGDKYAGIDVTDLEPEQAGEFIALTNALHQEYIQKLQEIQARYDVKHNYRQFLASGVSDLTEI
jgi:hypothetical protein